MRVQDGSWEREYTGWMRIPICGEGESVRCGSAGEDEG